MNLKVKNLEKNLDLFLHPEIRIYEKPNTLTYEASIRTGILKDYYLTMSNIDRSDYYNIKFQKNLYVLDMVICYLNFFWWIFKII